MKLATTPEIARDRWGRPLVPNPLPDGKPVAHQRPSSIAMKIADRFNLEQWQMRMVAKGMAIRPDLVTLAHALDPDDADDKKQLRRVVEDAKEAAGALRGANIGTALHSIVRQINAGHDPAVEDQHKPAIDAYRRCIEAHQIEPVLLEQFVVWPDMRIAGSCDLYANYQGRLVVMDLKTGQHDPTSFSMVEQAAQFACYANATHTWDGETAEPLPPYYWGTKADIDTDLAYLIWMPSGGDICELIEVDITKGRRWVELAAEVADAHRDKTVGRRITAPAATDDPTRRPHSLHARIGRLRQRLKWIVANSDNTVDTIKALQTDYELPPLTKPDELTVEHVDSWESLVMFLELELDPGARRDSIIARLTALPDHLYTLAQTRAKALEPPIPHLKSNNITHYHLERLEEILQPLENEATNSTESTTA